MTTDITQRSVLVLGRSRHIINEVLDSLDDLGFRAQVTNDFSDIVGRFDVEGIDMIVIGSQLPADRKAELQGQIAAINPEVVFVDSLIGIPGVIVGQIQSVFNADQQDPAQAPLFTPDDRSIRVTLTDAADARVVVYWRTSFVPPDPKSDSLLLLDDRLAAGEHTVAVPSHIPPIFAYATVQIGAAYYAFSIATEPEPIPVAGLALPNQEDTAATAVATARFADPAPAPSLDPAAAALTAHGFTVEILDDAAAARARVAELIPEGATVFTGASETLRLSGIEDDINTTGRYDALKPQLQTMDRVTEADTIRQLTASPDVVVGSVAALTETGCLVAASATGTQLPAYAGGAAHAIWIVGAQKVVPDLDTALRRVQDHVLPLESARAQAVYGRPSAVNRILVLNAEPRPGRGTVLLLRQAIGF